MRLDRAYRRTPSGDEAFRSVDEAIPVDYRRILCLVDGETHANVIRGRLRRFSDALIADWLSELEEIGFLESVSVSGADAYDLDFKKLGSESATIATLGSVAGEQQRIEEEARAAGDALRDKGAYLSAARIENRDALSKDASQIVVLLVEDDQDQAALGDLRLSMAGYRVRIARNIQEMVQDLSMQPLPDVVLLDVMLPDGNGFGILSCMRTDPHLSLLPVIMLTSLSATDDIRRGLDVGADGYITKPYSKDLLVATIRAVLRLV